MHVKFNPEHLNKNMFRESGRELIPEGMNDRLEGLRAGILHLHSLGLVHNDINPSNIMFDEDGNFILIDFDSCRRIGENLHETDAGRTWAWHDPDVKIALPKNDLDAFEDLRIWMVGSPDERSNFE
ncbi:hypothetical protein PENSTE_c003G06034 [Penicillium steckii]|uniref:Protein kinase domain-containing protein n=1 Tax=Penicillium steckii TaxID=303698 RepID=A0A1V6TRR7_9EURO|nr:hypothetical protein PENSTE_c003G06034 [Penicillium steckii]